MYNERKNEEFMLEKIISVISEQLSVEPDSITIDSDITDDLGADSLDIIELTDRLEKMFGITATDDEIMSVETVGDLEEILTRKISGMHDEKY